MGARGLLSQGDLSGIEQRTELQYSHNRYISSLPLALLQGHLVSGYIYLMWIAQVHPISWTIPHCVLVLKLIGTYVTRTQYHDGEVYSITSMVSFPDLHPAFCCLQQTKYMHMHSQL